MPDDKPPLRIGLIGCGRVASYGHLPAIAATPGLELSAICDPDVDRLDQVRQQFGVPDVFEDPEALCAHDLDAVAITSPMPYHAEHVRFAARHGRHVLCEKPLADDESQAKEMIDQMARARRLLAVGFTYRFSPVAMTIKKLIQQNAIGQARSLRLIYVWDCHGRYNRRDEPNSGVQQRRLERMNEGGPLIDCGVHQIDLARWWLDQEVTRYSAHGIWVEDHRNPDHLYLHMQHERGAHSTVEVSYSYGHTAKDRASRFTYDIIGTEGLIRFDREHKLFELRTAQGVTALPWAGEKSFVNMYAAFRDAIVHGRDTHLATGQDGLIATRLATEATLAARGHRPNGPAA